ncbi:Ldh family oxidoreductase [Paenibacillus sp. BSR1-1]|uniref:Ldh family oxidoreductase n=1 Tax=Paenibacillus sp. BSR1-1 TaxID=3020845 RepID=UPI0025B1B049|nr:Ldh family oxidoreductase [Paenibacillus sp. BSR1-1]MDN3017974.1 Ldh family oxidoreductase [Paenibacillus sp. BSR1-1]
MNGFHNVQPVTLEKVVAGILEKNNVPTEDAQVTAASLVDADLRGVSSHGVMRLPIYLSRLQNGVIPGAADVQIIKETASTAVLDGRDGLGQVVSKKAIDILLEKAEKNAISAVTVRNSNHYGAAAYWASKIQEKNMIGFSFSNVEPLMPPPGGAAARIGNNPISIVVPSGDARPIVVDMATSTVPLGKIINAKNKGESIPEGWAVDSTGKSTTDPEKVVNGGFLFPVGGPKGYSLAIIVDVLSALLSGGAIGNEINSMYNDIENPNCVSHFFMAIRIDAFIEPAIFYQAVQRYTSFIKDTPLAEGSSGIFMPGEIEHLNKEKNVTAGINLPDAVFDQLVELANEAGLEAALISEFEQSQFV